jgi:hypothetical protein
VPEFGLTKDAQVVGVGFQVEVIEVERADDEDRGGGGYEAGAQEDSSGTSAYAGVAVEFAERLVDESVGGFDRGQREQGGLPLGGFVQGDLTDAAGFAVLLEAAGVVGGQDTVQVVVDVVEDVVGGIEHDFALPCVLLVASCNVGRPFGSSFRSVAPTGLWHPTDSLDPTAHAMG